MAAIGRWLQTHNEAVRGTQVTNLDTGNAIVSTRTRNVLYLFLCRWPEADRLSVPDIRSLPSAVRLMGASHRLRAQLTERGLELCGLPMVPPHDCVSVVKLRFRTAPRLDCIKRARIPAQTVVVHGRTAMSVTQAKSTGLGVKGQPLRIDAAVSPARAHTVDWSAPEQQLVWRIDVRQSGTYLVRVRLACPRPHHGSTYVLAGSGATLRGTVSPTASFGTYAWQRLGTLHLRRGKGRLVLHPVHMPYGYIFAHVADIELEPQ